MNSKWVKLELIMLIYSQVPVVPLMKDNNILNIKTQTSLCIPIRSMVGVFQPQDRINGHSVEWLTHVPPSVQQILCFVLLLLQKMPHRYRLVWLDERCNTPRFSVSWKSQQSYADVAGGLSSLWYLSESASVDAMIILDKTFQHAGDWLCCLSQDLNERTSYNNLCTFFKVAVQSD